MSSDSSQNKLVNLWQNQPSASSPISPEQMVQRMERLKRKLFRRDLIIYILCAGETAWFLYCIATIHQPIVQAAMAMIVAGVAFLAGQLWFNQRQRISSQQSLHARAATDSVSFYRGELERQRNFHRGTWFWSRMAALFPGMFTFFACTVVAYPRMVAGSVLIAVTAVIFVVAVAVNARMARTYQRQIDTLEAYTQRP